MEAKEELAYAYWKIIDVATTMMRLKDQGILSEDDRQLHTEHFRVELMLSESLQQLLDHTYIERLIETYGKSMEDSPIPIYQAKTKVKKTANIPSSYMNFHEIIALSNVAISSGYALQSWLRSHNTIEILMLWERKNNESFNMEEANCLIKECKADNSALTLKQWIARTGAIGIQSMQGRYGGTYATQVIATDFRMWLSPQERLSTLESIQNKSERGIFLEF